MNYLIMTLIIVFGGILVAISLTAVAILRRMERTITRDHDAHRAILRMALRGEPPDSGGPVPTPLRRKKHLSLFAGGAAAMAALLGIARRHAWSTVALAASAAAAAAVMLALVFTSNADPAGPPTGGNAPSRYTAWTTSISSPAAPGTAIPSTPPSATGAPGSGASPSTVAVPVSSATAPPSTTGAAASTPSRSGSSSSVAATPTGGSTSSTAPTTLPIPPSSTPAPSPTGSSLRCIVRVGLPPLLRLCLL